MYLVYRQHPHVGQMWLALSDDGNWSWVTNRRIAVWFWTKTEINLWLSDHKMCKSEVEIKEAP